MIEPTNQKTTVGYNFCYTDLKTPKRWSTGETHTQILQERPTKYKQCWDWIPQYLVESCWNIFSWESQLLTTYPPNSMKIQWAPQNSKLPVGWSLAPCPLWSECRCSWWIPGGRCSCWPRKAVSVATSEPSNEPNTSKYFWYLLV